MKALILAISVVLLASCAAIVRNELDEKYGAADPSRLYLDAHGPAEWRKRGFSPVLNERASTPEAELDASVLFRALRLKQDAGAKPLAAKTAADAPQSCPAMEEFDRFAAASPHAGMPYGLPALSAAESGAIADWLKAGAPY